MAYGWISIHRKIQDNDLWLDPEPFDRRSAWIDLILLANHEDKKVIFDGGVVEVKRGSKITSLRKLSDKWKWSVGKVKRFLELLRDLEMIEFKCDSKKTTYTICNYNVYQNEDLDKRNTDGTPKTHENLENGNYANNKRNSERTPVSIDNKANRSHRNDFNGTVTEHRRNSDGTQTETNNNDINNVNNVNKSTMYHSIIEEWNLLDKNIAKVNSINSGTQRHTLLNARINEYGYEEVLKAIRNISKSRFLKGYGDKGWTITFDWFIKPNNFIKVLEGVYSDKGNMSNPKETSYTQRNDEHYRSYSEIARKERIQKIQNK